MDDPEIAAQLLKESNRATSSRSSRGPSCSSDLSRDLSRGPLHNGGTDALHNNGQSHSRLFKKHFKPILFAAIYYK